MDQDHSNKLINNADVLDHFNKLINKADVLLRYLINYEEIFKFTNNLENDLYKNISSKLIENNFPKVFYYFFDNQFLKVFQNNKI